MRTSVLIAGCLLAVSGVASAGQLVGDIQPKLGGAALVKELQKGGHVIYFRHGATADFDEKEVADADLSNCALQRPLSITGQTQTKSIGRAFKRLGIPVGDVFSSPYCRCLDTARNIFGKSESSKILYFAIHLQNSDRASVTARLMDLLSTAPTPGTNMALVSHSANLQEAVGIWPKPEGVAHVFKPLGNGQFSYVGTMLPEAWAQEAERAVTGSNHGVLSTFKQWFRGSQQ